MPDETPRLATDFTLDELEVLIRENYAARQRRELPDEWFWADKEALRRGYTLNRDGRLVP